MDGELYRYQGGAQREILHGIACSKEAADDHGWLSVVGYGMDEDAQTRLVVRIFDRDDPLTGLGLFVLAHHISETALGIELPAAATLALNAAYGWFPFTAWAASRGLEVAMLPMHVLLPSVYGWLSHGCGEQKDLDRLNRRIFGSVSPW